MSGTNNFEPLLKEIEDKYVQENFYRLKLYLESIGLGSSSGGGGTTIIGGGSSVSVWEKFTRSLPSSSTTIADTINLASFRQLEYIINYRDSVTKREKSIKVTVLKDDTTLEEQVYAVSGAPLSIGLNTNINGSNYELEITNNEPNTVDMSFARLTLP